MCECDDNEGCTVCQACGGNGKENEYIDADNEIESSNECAACDGTGYEEE